MPVKKSTKTAKTTRSAKTTSLNLDNLITEALKLKASSIHLERHGDDAKIRWRISNELKSGQKISVATFDKLSIQLKGLANVDPQATAPQEGRFKIIADKKQLNIGAAFWPMYEGEKIVVKILDNHNANLSTLLLTEEDFTKIASTLREKSGLILLTEMKLADKNRLLYALLNHLDREALDIFTLEDFIEYPLPGIHQQQLENYSDAKLSQTLAKLSRHEPDVVMVSKISGPESARQVIDSAANNLVLAYLPGRDLKESMLFFRNWGIDDYILETVLKYIITQSENKFKII